MTTIFRLTRLTAVSLIAIAMSGPAVLAADNKTPLPTESAPEERVAIPCPQYGAGFVRYTEKGPCVRISGYVQAEASWVSSGSRGK